MLLRHAVQNKEIFAEHVTVSRGTPVFRGTPVEKHCASAHETELVTYALWRRCDAYRRVIATSKLAMMQTSFRSG